MHPITLRYFASARAAAGTETEVRTASTPADALAKAGEDYGAEFTRIIGFSSFLLNGTPLAKEETRTELTDAAILDVLPPFAGG